MTYMKLNTSQKHLISVTTACVTLVTKSRFLLAHDKSFHIRNKTRKPKIEEKPTENIPKKVKPKVQIQEKLSPSSQTKINITQKEKVFNSVTRTETNEINFLSQPGELFFVLLLAVPILLFSMKRWKYK